MSSRVTTAARAAFFVLSLALPLLYFLVLNPIFTKPNTFEDGIGYLTSATRLMATGSPYQDWQLAGPYGAVTPSDTFRYPPPFAQVAEVFVLTGTEWLFVGALVATSFLAALVLARSLRDAALAVWLGLAFFPDYYAAWEGQVTGLLAFAVAFALSGSAIAIWAGAVLKVTPVLALPAAFVRMPRAVVLSGAVLLPLLAASVVVSPVAWWQFPTVLVNQFLGGADYETLAPTGVWRYAALAVVVASLLASLVLAPSRWPLALYLAVVAGLLLPGFLPKYALPVLVPFLFVGLRDEGARPWSLLAFFPLALPFTSFSGPFFVGVGLLGVSMWRLGSGTVGGRFSRAAGGETQPDRLEAAM